MPVYFKDLGEFAGFCYKAAAEFDAAVSESLKIVAENVRKDIRNTIGDPNKLAPLSPATVEERERLGYDGNQPLLRDGDLRESYTTAHGPMWSGVGSDSQLALYHELGYLNARTGTMVPPRPVMQLSIRNVEAENIRVLATVVPTVLRLGGTPFISV